MNFTNDLCTVQTPVSPPLVQAPPQLLPDRSLHSIVSDLRARGLAHPLVDPNLAGSFTSGNTASTISQSQQLPVATVTTTIGAAAASGIPQYPPQNSKRLPVSVPHAAAAVRPLPCRKMSFKRDSHSLPNNKNLNYLAFDPPPHRNRRDNNNNTNTNNNNLPLTSFQLTATSPSTSPITSSTPDTAVQPMQSVQQRSATSPQTPTRHSRSASRQIKFKCPLCPSTFSRKDNLKTHQRLHSGEMPFQCQYCGRKFRWQSSARTHEQVHERHGHSPMAGASDSASSSQATRSQQRAAAASSGRGRASASGASSAVSSGISSDPQVFNMPMPMAAASSLTRATVPGPASLPMVYGTSQDTHQRLPTNNNTFTHAEASQQRLPTNYLAVTDMHQMPPTNYAATDNTQRSTTINTARPIADPNEAARALAARRAREGGRHELDRGIRRSRPPPPLLLNLDDILEEQGGEIGSEAPGTTVTTPQQQNESPMFSLPKLSQQDLERCLEPDS